MHWKIRVSIYLARADRSSNSSEHSFKTNKTVQFVDMTPTQSYNRISSTRN